MERAYAWCVKRTLRDWRRSAAKGRPITPPNLERLFARRWWRVATSGEAADAERRGRRAVRKAARAGAG